MPRQTGNGRAREIRKYSRPATVTPADLSRRALEFPHWRAPLIPLKLRVRDLLNRSWLCYPKPLRDQILPEMRGVHASIVTRASRPLNSSRSRSSRRRRTGTGIA